jgi:rSAM/selenodomain-associated transferase 1
MVMARAPRLGEGKSRLRARLSDEERLRLQEAFLRDTLDMALNSNIGRVYLAVTPPGAAAWAQSEFSDKVTTLAQLGNDLGQRMIKAMQEAASEGHGPVIVIGTDTPLLATAHLHAALRGLDSADVCFGPSDDGGYYLVASNEPQASIFQDVAWGTDQVLKTSLALARDAGLKCALLDELYDVDTPADLERLVADLRSSGEETARHTRQVLLQTAVS